MSALVTLVCRACGRRAPYLRSNDPNLPAACETISQGKCDRCDDGDFSEEWLLDAAGNEIDPAEYGAST
ncbi:MAG TPA: hypothetical protein VJP88_00495 [Caulobacteraceae bacterium]|nr:hypothetical protein [Caulobacteraceae bacterium]